jgi:hypothetical protein
MPRPPAAVVMLVNMIRFLATTTVLLLGLSAYQTYLNAADCRFYGLSYSWFRGQCIGSHKARRRAEPIGLSEPYRFAAAEMQVNGQVTRIAVTSAG